MLANLTAQVGGRVRRRLDLTAEEETELRRAPSRAAPHWATYWTGTFIVSKRTRGDADPERWWAQYDDITKQTGFLKAYAAERLPELLTVDRVRFADCGRCGGRGRVKKMSFMGNQSVGGNEWWETCPQCHGQGRERSVAYR